MVIGRLRQSVASLLGILLLPDALLAAENALVGRWEFADASFPMPAACRGGVFQYTSDGYLLASDGSFEEKKRYTAAPYKNGYLVETTYVSNNGKNNCQGLRAAYVRTNTIEKAYIELLGVERIKIHFGAEATKEFMIFKKSGSSS
jgi:hypothetical protein